MENRLIGIFDEGLPGSLVIILGGIHGNERAGIHALDFLIKMLEVEPITNETFRFYGRLVAMRGNIRALKVGKRYIRRDLNRMFRGEEIAEIRKKKVRDEEEQELLGILDCIRNQIDDYPSEKVFLLDLHTTTAEGGIFAIVDGSPLSLEIGLEIKAPVIKGFLEGINGTLLHYIRERPWKRECVGLVFEAGQHDDPLSVNRAIGAAVNFLSAVGAVEKLHIAERHHRLLREAASGLSAHCRLLYSHKLTSGDGFKMIPGFRNFEPVEKGQLLARDHTGEIVAREAGLILMPLYQEQGEDGFFIIEPVSEQVIE